MSEIARRRRAAVKQYEADHPDVDWTAHDVILRHDPPGEWPGNWVAVGHSEKIPEIEAMDNWCCNPGGCSLHSGRGSADE